ncbi:TetR/AcrR family transcriptional regulator [Salmonella enterica]|nr:TetR/AcrR family transcriptional regulator [Salmonella enterica]
MAGRWRWQKEARITAVVLMAISITRHTVKTVSEKCTSKNKGSLTPREIFIQAGIELLNKRGPDSLSLNEILTQANKPRGSFYAAFGSKEVWLSALIRRYFQPPTDVLTLFAEGVSSGRQDTIRAWASWSVQRVKLAICRGDRIVSLTEMAGRCRELSLTAETCDVLFCERSVALSKLLRAAFLLPEPAASDQACLVLTMLDGVESRASATRRPELVEHFYQYFFNHMN